MLEKRKPFDTESCQLDFDMNLLADIHLLTCQRGLGGHGVMQKKTKYTTHWTVSAIRCCNYSLFAIGDACYMITCLVLLLNHSN